MSPDVTTHENCARLQVARRVKDIAKAIIRLSRLGRSIFVMPFPQLANSRNSWFGLRVRRTCVNPGTSIPCDALFNASFDTTQREADTSFPRCRVRLLGTDCGLPSLPSSPPGAGAGVGPGPAGVSDRRGGPTCPRDARRARSAPYADRDRRTDQRVAGG